MKKFLKGIPLNFYTYLVFLCAVGLVDSTYLLVKHYASAGIACLIFRGCDAVLGSSYSEIAGIPVALFGVLFYAAVIFFLVLSHKKKKKIILQILVALITGGFLMSAYFVYLQVFVIQAICTYCMVSALVSTTLFVSSVSYLIKYHHYYE